MKKIININKAEDDYIHIGKKKYFDLSLQSGVLLLGHSNKTFNKSLNQIIKNKYTISKLNNNNLDKSIFKLVKKYFKSAHELIYCTTGSEAVTKAIRIARALNQNKNKIFIVNGSWHGSVDQTLFKAKNNLRPIPMSAGIENIFKSNVKILPFGDINKTKKILNAHYRHSSCILIEPVAASLPMENRKVYLKYLRDFCTKKKLIMIFDEMITGIRTAKGSVQNKYNIFPDITVAGKAIGGGLPISFILLNKELSIKITKLKNKIFFGGTYSGNNYSVLSSYNTLKYIKKNMINNMIKNSAYFQKEINYFCTKNNLGVEVYRFDGFLRLIYSKKKISNIVARDFFEVKNRIKIEKFKKYLFNKKILYPNNGVIFFSTMINREKTDFLITNICEGIKKFFKN